MSKKASAALIDPADEKFIAQQLTTHIAERKDGVLVKPSDPTAFPLVDAVTIANAWKLNYPTRFSRYTKQSLELVIKKVYTTLSTEHKSKQSTPTTPVSTLSRQASAIDNTQLNSNGKKPLIIKETTLVKRKKANNSFIDDNKKVQLSPATPLQAGASAMTLALQAGIGDGSQINKDNSLFASNPFDTLLNPDVSINTNNNNNVIINNVNNNEKKLDSNSNVNSKIASNIVNLSDNNDISMGLNSDNDENLSDIEIDLINDNDDGDNDIINAFNNDDDDSDVTMLDEKTRSLTLSTTPSTTQLSQQLSSSQQNQPVLHQTLSNKANVNSSLNNLYNPTAVPYSQRQTQQNDTPKQLTKRQQQDKILKNIQEEAKQNVPRHIQLKQRYKYYRDQGSGHKEAEALARQELGMDFVQENLPSKGTKGGRSGQGGSGNKKDDKPVVVPIKSTVTLKDVGGIDTIIQDIREIIEYPLTHPEIFTHLGVSPPKGVLLHGPPGSGKTLLANAIAGELDIPLIKIQATEIVSKLSGESEGKIRSIFTDAAQHAPCIIFIDDIDVLASKKDSDDGNDMKRRIVTQLIASIDALGENTTDDGNVVKTDLQGDEAMMRKGMNFEMDNNDNLISTPNQAVFSPSSQQQLPSTAERALQSNEDDALMFRTAMMNNNNQNKTIIVLGATSRLDSIDTSLRRAGRFDREIGLGIPDEFARAQILKKLTAKMRLAPNCNLDQIGKQTVGFVGADLLALTREAAVLSLNRIFTDEKAWDLGQLQQLGLDNVPMTPLSPSLTAPVENGSDLTAQQDFAMQVMSMNDDDAVKDNTINTNNQQSEQNNNTSTTTTAANTTTTDSLSQTLITNNKTLPLTKTQQKRFDLAQRTKISLFLRNSGPLSQQQLAPFSISHSDFVTAAKKVQPTAKREGFATVPETTWADIGALDLLRAELDMAIVQPIQEPELFEQLGLNTPAGVLLFGPPGCGKTLVAKAVANASGASFLSVKGPELLNQYVGESERAVRSVFNKAAMCAPCVIFFDEIDALVPRRGGASGNQASERVVNQLLTELDGFDDRRQVFVIAATNRPDIIDPAVLRPGRLDKLLYLPLPDADGRHSILMKHTRRTPFDFANLPGTTNDEKRSLLLKTIAYDQRAENYSGADMQALVREATTAALKEYQAKRAEIIIQNGDLTQLSSKILVTLHHFDIAFGRVVASVTAKARKEYEQLCQTMTQGKGVLRKDVHTVEHGSQSGGASR